MCESHLANCSLEPCCCKAAEKQKKEEEARKKAEAQDVFPEYNKWRLTATTPALLLNVFGVGMRKSASLSRHLKGPSLKLLDF